MKKDQKQPYQGSSAEQSSSTPPLLAPEDQEIEEIAPGVPVIRSCTPRPLSFDPGASYSGYFRSVQPPSEPVCPMVFPNVAPDAPPLPEELGDALSNESELDADVISPPEPEKLPESLWLFEYGLEMDPAILNSPERLAGDALFHGPAVLKGYALQFGAKLIHGSLGTSIVAIVPSSDPDAEVWGVLYRVPQRLTVGEREMPSCLDTIHAAISPQNLLKGEQVVVYEPYQDQEIVALTYVATDVACQELQLASPAEWQQSDPQFIHRLTAIAREGKLPPAAVSQYSASQQILSANTQPIANIATSMPGIPLTNMPLSLPMTNPEVNSSSEMSSQQNEQTTEQLPKLRHALMPTLPKRPSAPSPANRSLIVFAIYLAILLLTILTLAILQGLGCAKNMLTPSFTLLGVPWLVAAYGLLGGCVSSLVTLGRLRNPRPLLFIVITWFARPFIGAVLAIFTYLLLTSGLFILGQNVEKHITFFWLIGALAGFCEGRLFFRQLPQIR